MADEHEDIQQPEMDEPQPAGDADDIAEADAIDSDDQAAASAPDPAEAQRQKAALDAAKAAIAGLGASSAVADEQAPPSQASSDNDPFAAARAAMAAASSASADAQPFELPALSSGPPGERSEEIDLLGDVNLNVEIELGRTRMLLEDVLKMKEGVVVELDKLAGDPVDVYVNDRLVARGEVLVLNENFCVRISEILDPTVAEAQRQSA